MRTLFLLCVSSMVACSSPFTSSALHDQSSQVATWEEREVSRLLAQAERDARLAAKDGQSSSTLVVSREGCYGFAVEAIQNRVCSILTDKGFTVNCIAPGTIWFAW